MSARDTVFGRTPLHYAATTVRVEELRVLLDTAVGLSVGVVDGNGQTPLHWAASMGKAGSVEVLLKRGANVAVRDGRGMTPLHVVARHPYARKLSGKYETVAWLLIRRGADGTIRDRSGNRVVDLLEGRWRGTVRRWRAEA
jgi:ankyrin repeat protein